MSNYRRENFPKSIYYAKRYVRINSEGDKYIIDKATKSVFCSLIKREKNNSLLVGSLDDISTLLTAVRTEKLVTLEENDFRK